MGQDWPLSRVDVHAASSDLGNGDDAPPKINGLSRYDLAGEVNYDFLMWKSIGRSCRNI
jgi:hypothetical protein